MLIILSSVAHNINPFPVAFARYGPSLGDLLERPVFCALSEAAASSVFGRLDLGWRSCGQDNLL